MTTPRYRAALMLLALAVFLVWTYVLVGSVCREERAEIRRGWMLDNAGTPVEVLRVGYVWELGRGTRPATEEETEDTKR